MVQFKILNGKTAGAEAAARRFPFWIGRAAEVDLRMEEDGVWDRHAEILLEPEGGFLIKAKDPALVSVNGNACSEAALRNGDELGLGAAKLRFWIGPTRQAGQGWREWLTWAVFLLITAGQVVLVYRLAP